MSSLFNTLKERGFVAQCSDESLPSMLDGEPLTVFTGFDPTANSLHLGHLAPIMAMRHFQLAGHKVILLVGGATGMIGDPSGRSLERNLLDAEAVARNVESIKLQLQRFVRLDGPNPAVIVDNLDWFSPMNMLTFLRDFGKHFNLRQMLGKDSVHSRLESPHGISFTEFSYMTLQAMDFLHLFDRHGCTLQCGGSDQWGNITAGIELIRKARQANSFALTFPLTTNANGEKFGKSAGNAVWLDASRTSPWDFFQFLVQQQDADVLKLLKLFSFVSLDEIGELEKELKDKPQDRVAQKRLALELTTLVHGEEAARQAVAKANLLFGGVKQADSTVCDWPVIEVTQAELDSGIDLLQLLVDQGFSPSKSRGRNLIETGGIQINGVVVKAFDRKITAEDIASAQSGVLLKSGKNRFHLIKVKADST